MLLSNQKSGHVNLHFVIPASSDSEDHDAINEMKMAFQECSEADLSPEWISEEECLNLPLTKMDVLVLHKFEGEVFNKLRRTKSVRVCGPFCLRTCLVEGATIPENNSPVFTTAMRNLCITASSVTQAKKTLIKERVRFMGGIYTSNLVEATTHLVSNAVRSAKYEEATVKGIQVMTDKWIETVWNISSKRNVKATDPEFDKFKCKVFQDLEITCSRLDKKEKEKVINLITENGGIYNPQLRQNKTSLLVINGPLGEKYTHARSWNLPCVYSSWIIESVEKGYAVPTTKHLLTSKMKSSTPTSSESGNFTLVEGDQISHIIHDVDNSRVNETQLSNTTVFSGKITRSQLKPPTTFGDVKYKQILESVNVATAKRAGLFVDGCKIYLSGFNVEEVERLKRLLSLGGASVFNELSDTVSYVVVGDHVANDVKTISNMVRRPHVVSLEWLTASIKQRGPASGDVYSCLDQLNIPVEPPSPLSQKGLQLLQPGASNKQETVTVQTPVNRKLFKDFAMPEGNKQSPTLNNPSENCTQDSVSSVSQDESQVSQFFKDLTFKIDLQEDYGSKEIEQVITTYGGTVVGLGFKGVPDYCIVPIDREVRNVTASEIVTYLWVEDCYSCDECLQVEYYHQPFTVNSAKKPLSGLCLSTTFYSGKEKVFLLLLGEALGAMCQDMLARKPNPATGVHVSTHLISPVSTGKKYRAAKRWNIPVVTKDWLLTCAKNGIKMPEDQFLLDNDATVESQEKDDQVMEPPVETNSSVPRNCSKSSEDASDHEQSSMGPPNFPLPSKSSSMTSITHPSTESSNFGHLLVEKQNSKHLPTRITPGKRKSFCTPESDTVSPFHIDTPETPYGQVFETPSKSTKKRWKKFVDNIGKFAKEVSPPVNPRRDSTPMTELRKQMWKTFFDEEPQENQADSSRTRNIEMTSLDGKENNEPVSNTPQQLYRSEAGEPSAKIQKIQSPTVTEAMPSSSNNTPGDRVTQHLEKLDEKLANHTPPEPSVKRHQNPNTLQPLNTPHNSSTSKQIPKPGVFDSQPITIDWEEPIETAERSKLNNMKSLEATNPVRRFVLGSDLKNQAPYADIIRNLGGEINVSTSFDISTTHIIVENPVRSEKLLCSIASGKWVLHTNYLLQCAKENKWLPEEDYECGNPRSVRNIPDCSVSSLELANAAYKWRNKLKDGKGAFSGVKVLIMNISLSNKGSFERLIIAGGGIVVDEAQLSEATYCCMNPWTGAMPDFVKELVKKKIPCVKPIFLGEYLYRDPPPKLQDHILPNLKYYYD